MGKASMKVRLDNVRCSYVYIDREKKDGGYGIQPLIPEGSKLHKKLEKIVDKVLAEGHGQDALKKKGKFKLPLRSGNDERDGEEYEDMIFFNANNGRKPGVVVKDDMGDLVPAMPEDMEEKGYSGCYFNLSVTFYTFEAKDGGKPGVAASINNVMLWKEGDRLDGSTSATEDFSDFAEDDDDL